MMVSWFIISPYLRRCQNSKWDWLTRHRKTFHSLVTMTSRWASDPGRVPQYAVVLHSRSKSVGIFLGAQPRVVAARIWTSHKDIAAEDCALLSLTVVDLFLTSSCLRANGHGQDDDLLGQLTSACSLGKQGTEWDYVTDSLTRTWGDEEGGHFKEKRDHVIKI